MGFIIALIAIIGIISLLIVLLKNAAAKQKGKMFGKQVSAGKIKNIDAFKDEHKYRVRVFANSPVTAAALRSFFGQAVFPSIGKTQVQGANEIEPNLYLVATTAVYDDYVVTSVSGRTKDVKRQTRVNYLVSLDLSSRELVVSSSIFDGHEEKQIRQDFAESLNKALVK